jgi:hypothetical protein
MLAATLIGVFFTPLFYWAAMTYLGGGGKAKGAAPPGPAPGHGAPASAVAHKEHDE